MEAVLKNKMLDRFAEFIRDWVAHYPARVGEFRSRIAAGLKMKEEEFDSWIKIKSNTTAVPAESNGTRSKSLQSERADIGLKSAIAASPVAASKSVDAYEPPAEAIDPPLGAAAKRPVISNTLLTWQLEIIASETPENDVALDEPVRQEIEAMIERKNLGALDRAGSVALNALLKKHGCTLKSVVTRKPIDLLRKDVTDAMNGWPYRLKIGALIRKKSKASGGGFELITKVERFNSILQEYGDVKFADKRDKKGSNYVSKTDLFQSFMRSEEVREFMSVEEAPFEPPIPGHLIDWKAPEDYVPDGRYFVEFCKLFDNIEKFHHRAIAAAAALTPVWGGIPDQPYGIRPVIGSTASQVGSGKSTFVQLVSRWTTKYVTLDLDKRTEERLRTRLLSGDKELTSRILFLDNVKTYLDSGFLEGFVTQDFISGEVKFAGEGSKPNTFTMFVSGNNLKVSTDFARRFFFIHFTKQTKAGNWNKHAFSFVAQNRHRILADALFILKQPVKAIDWNMNLNETYRDWCENVLARVCQFPALQEWTGGCDAESVIWLNQEERGEADMDVMEAANIREEVMDRLCTWKGWYYRGENDFKLPTHAVDGPFDPVVRAQAPKKNWATDYWDGASEAVDRLENFGALEENNMLAWFGHVLSSQKRSLTANWVTRVIEKHRGAKRIEWMEPVHKQCGSCYLIYRTEIEKWLKERWQKSQSANNVSPAPGT